MCWTVLDSAGLTLTLLYQLRSVCCLQGLTLQGLHTVPVPSFTAFRLFLSKTLRYLSCDGQMVLEMPIRLSHLYSTNPMSLIEYIESH